MKKATELVQIKSIQAIRNMPKPARLIVKGGQYHPEQMNPVVINEIHAFMVGQLRKWINEKRLYRNED